MVFFYDFWLVFDKAGSGSGSATLFFKKTDCSYISETKSMPNYLSMTRSSAGRWDSVARGHALK